VGVTLIRASNYSGVTAYQDAVLFHLFKGANGVIPGVGNEFAASYSTATKKLTIQSGQGIIYGRQFEIPSGETAELDLSALSSVKYVSVFAELDTRDSGNEVVTIKSLYDSTTYPTIDPGDNLIQQKTGVARIMLYKMIFRPTSGATITKAFNMLRNDWIANADNANSAKNADKAKDSTRINDNLFYASDDGMKIIRSGTNDTDIIEYKKKLYDGAKELRYQLIGTVIPINSAVKKGDVLEFVFDANYSANSYSPSMVVQRAYVSQDGNGNLYAHVAVALGSVNADSVNAEVIFVNFKFSGTNMIYMGGRKSGNLLGSTVTTTAVIKLFKVFNVKGG
jgi:hypothetical protein